MRKTLGTFTTVERQVLEQAVADGGDVVLNGVDAHDGWSKRHLNAARRLAVVDYGSMTIDRNSNDIFQISAKGRKSLTDRFVVRLTSAGLGVRSMK